jgi:hypothetical protein
MGEHANGELEVSNHVKAQSMPSAGQCQMPNAKCRKWRKPNGKMSKEPEV